MNKFVATVKKIDTADGLNIVSFDFLGYKLSMISLDLKDSIKVGVKVELTANPSHVAIGKDFSGMVSYSNQLKAKISELENGKLLSNIKFQVGDFTLESFITLNSSKKMNLKIDDEVTVFIKATELSILRVLDA